MTNWTEVTVRLERTMDDGRSKKVTEKYLVEAASCSEAEERIIKELLPTGDYDVKSVAQRDLAEVFFNNNVDGSWYKVKIGIVTIDEKTGQEKLTPQTLMVEGQSVKDAINELDMHMRGSVSDWTLLEVVFTKVLSAYPIYHEQ